MPGITRSEIVRKNGKLNDKSIYYDDQLVEHFGKGKSN